MTSEVRLIRVWLTMVADPEPSLSPIQASGLASLEEDSAEALEVEGSTQKDHDWPDCLT